MKKYNKNKATLMMRPFYILTAPFNNLFVEKHPFTLTNTMKYTGIVSFVKSSLLLSQT